MWTAVASARGQCTDAKATSQSPVLHMTSFVCLFLGDNQGCSGLTPGVKNHSWQCSYHFHRDRMQCWGSNGVDLVQGERVKSPIGRVLCKQLQGQHGWAELPELGAPACWTFLPPPLAPRVREASWPLTGGLSSGGPTPAQSLMSG